MCSEQEDKTLPTYLEAAAAHKNFQDIYNKIGGDVEYFDSDDEQQEIVTMPSLAELLNRPIITTSSSYGHFDSSSDDDNFADDSESSDPDSKYLDRFLLKPAMDVVPEDVKNYDVKSPPSNGSQYLMAVRKHNKKVPKVVVADLKVLEDKIRKRSPKTQELEGTVNSPPESTKAEKTDEYSDDDDILPLTEKEGSDAGASVPTFDIISSLLPTSKWKETVLDDFIKLRAKVDRLRSLIEHRKVVVNLPDQVQLPDNNNLVVWQRFCLGSFLCQRLTSKNVFPRIPLKDFLKEFFSKKITEESSTPPTPSGDDSDDIEVLNPEDFLESGDGTTEVAANESCSATISDDTSDKPRIQQMIRPPHFPILSILLNIEQRTLEFLISSHLAWTNSPGLIHSLQAQWIYALFVCVQEPLEANVMSDLRAIVRRCIHTRSKLFKAIERNPNTLDEVNVSELEKYVGTLDLFIWIVSKYFGQTDLLEEADYFCR